MSLPLTQESSGHGAATAVGHGAWRRSLVGLGVGGVLLGAGAANGAYFPGAWGWVTLACTWLGVLALVFDDRAAVTRGGVAYLGLLVAVAGWTLLTAAWSVSPTGTALEAQRALMLVAAVFALVVGGRRSHRHVLTGVWAAVSLLCGYGLLTRLLPERLGVTDSISGYRLSQPIGYWNSLGLLAAMGILLALGLVVRRGPAVLRALAAGSFVPLASTLYFTYSRGAWAALIGGFAVVLAVDRRRLQLLTVGFASGSLAALSVAIASRMDALTVAGAQLADRSRQGHRLLLIDVGLALAGAAMAILVGWLEQRLRLGARVRAGVSAVAFACVVAAAVGAFVVYGTPWSLATRGWDAFASAPPAAPGSLNTRLFQLSGNGRVAQWDVAWKDEAAQHRLFGSGAGTYEQYWQRYRPVAFQVRDVHDLYLETLAEQGPVGLALLVGALGVPLALAWRARRRRLAPFALGAYVAYLLHALVDWDWEIGAVTLTALACGAVVVLAAASESSPPAGRRTRIALLAGAAVVAGLAVWGVGERVALARASASATRGDWSTAERDTRRAAELQPWSAEPWGRLGEAELRARRFAAARIALRKAVEHDPGDWQLWFRLAQASDGRERAAALDRARKLNPRSSELAAYVGTLRALSPSDGDK